MNISGERRLISFALMAYNDARFIEEALAAAFSQTYEPLEIIVSDDCSTDKTLELIEKTAAAYRGPHTIVVNSNERNLGVCGHINRIMELCSGELVVIAAADDISLPHRVQHMHDAFQASGGTAFSIHSSCVLINGSGDRIGTAQDFELFEADLETVIEEGTWLYGCTHAWHRDIFDKFGPLPADVTREDEVLPFRSLLLGTVGYIREPLVLYRLHEKNMSRGPRRVARDRRDLHDLVCGQLHERLANLRSYLADLEKAGDLVKPERRHALRERLLREIEYREREFALRKGSLQEKFEVLRQQNVEKFNPKPTAKALLWILLPELYMHYGYRRYKKLVTSVVEELPRGGPQRRTTPLKQWKK